MASPWSFLTRLVAPRRQKKDGGSSEDVKPNELAIAGSRETPDKENLNLVDQPTRERTHPLPRSEPAVEPHPWRKRAAIFRSRRVGAFAAPKVDETVRAAPTNRRRRAKKMALVAVGTQAALIVRTMSDEMSLDQEIRALRGQLDTKLRLQNTQLKEMLERFER